MAARTEGRTAEPARDDVAPGPAADLTVVYDDRCPLCRRCREWVLAQPQLVSYRFVAASEPWVQRWLGHIVPVGDDLVVVGRTGATWVGPDAFIVCLWGLQRYRALAVRLQRPGLRAVAKRAFHVVSAGRGLASTVLPDSGVVSDSGVVPDSVIRSALEGADVECGERSCTQ